MNVSKKFINKVSTVAVFFVSTIELSFCCCLVSFAFCEPQEMTKKVDIIMYKLLIFIFFIIGHNDRGYGLGWAAGEFPVAMATKEMRAQRLPEAHQPPKAHRRVLGVRSILFFCRLNFGCLKELSLTNRFSIPYLNVLSAR
ncbi:hypothetical protein SDC9_134230 [bioreactor metagenome]|uniref:Uncharacterized protein n=1 Tax=bioreactor metagenome TaxID=1076179 RepID=A0A645DD33_9ZZZZ